MMKNARYRMPVISPLHDVEVPKHLDLYKEHGVGVITITRANSRVLYMAKLKAKSPPTAAQLRKRRDLMEPFAAEQECPDCQVQVILNKDDEPSCTNCQTIFYPPPSAYLTLIANKRHLV